MKYNKRRTLTDEQIERYWNQGKPLAWIAAEAGVHDSTISKHRKARGLRPRYAARLATPEQESEK